MQLSYRAPLWLYPKPVDFRRQIDGLVLLIVDEFNVSPTSGELFIFRNRQCNKLKLLWYDGNGFWLCYKRLEKGKLIFPKHSETAMTLTRDQLSWLLSGLDFQLHKPLPLVEATSFY